jgi:CheY-like chemotaxis protein
MTRLLVVDDEKAIRELIVEVLKLANLYEFDMAGDGAEAIELMRQRKYDLIIVDRVMEGVGGVEMVQRVRQDPALADNKILICSASNIPKDIDEALASGADDYVVKPLDFTELIGVVARVLATPRKKR